MPDFDPSEIMEAAKARAGQAGILGSISGLLDAPGRAIRTALAGNLEDVLPSLFDRSRGVSGKQLAQQWGLIDKDNPDDDMLTKLGHTFVTTALDLGTNPLTYVNPTAALGRSLPGATGSAVRAASTMGIDLDAQRQAARNLLAAMGRRAP